MSTYTDMVAKANEQRPGGCPEWATARSEVSSRFDHTYRCNRPVKVEVLGGPYSDQHWFAVCGIHARQFQQRRPLSREDRDDG